MNRRTVLAGSVIAFTAVSGGCTLRTDEVRDGVVLTHVELGNASEEPRVFDLLVTHDEEIVHWSEHEVGNREGEGEVVEIDAPDEPGRVDVHVRVGRRWSSADFDTDEYAGERVIAVVTYGMVEDEMLRISRRVSDR